MPEARSDLGHSVSDAILDSSVTTPDYSILENMRDEFPTPFTFKEVEEKKPVQKEGNVRIIKVSDHVIFIETSMKEESDFMRKVRFNSLSPEKRKQLIRDLNIANRICDDKDRLIVKPEDLK